MHDEALTYRQAVLLQQRIHRRTQKKLSVSIRTLGDDEHFLDLRPVGGVGLWSIYSERDWLHLRDEVLSAIQGLRRL